MGLVQYIKFPIWKGSLPDIDYMSQKDAQYQRDFKYSILCIIDTIKIFDELLINFAELRI